MRLVVLVLMMLLAACGDDGGPPEAQPATDDTVFVEGDFSGLPLPPLSEPAGERSERDGVVAQSYFVRNMTPEQVLAFYDSYLSSEGAQVVSEPEPFGNKAWRGAWIIDDRELLVTSTPAPLAEGEVKDSDVVSQLSLELSPVEGDGHTEDD